MTAVTKRDAGWPENRKHANIFLSKLRLIRCFVSIHTKAVASNLSSSGGSHVSPLFIIEEQKKVGS